MLAALFFVCLMGCYNNFASVNEAGNDTTSFKKPNPVTDKFAWQPINYDSTKRYIYLTFDDGPQNGTKACLEICRNMGVKATFFMVGRHANSAATKKLVSEIHDAYPQMLLSNHSSSHANGHYKYFYLHPRMAQQDFLYAQRTLHVPYKIIRLPGNNAWVRKDVEKASDLVRPVCRLLDSAAYNVIGWDLEWCFNHKNSNPIQSPQRLANQVDTAFANGKVHAKNHMVILTHDRMFRNPNYMDSLAKFINIIKKDPRNIFETVDHYPGVKMLPENKDLKKPENIMITAQNLTKKHRPL